MESMRKSNILSWLLFVLISFSRIRTYSLLYWPKVYIPHCGWPFWRSMYGTKEPEDAHMKLHA
jgi:hypothetical protein